MSFQLHSKGSFNSSKQTNKKSLRRKIFLPSQRGNQDILLMHFLIKQKIRLAHFTAPPNGICQSGGHRTTFKKQKVYCKNYEKGSFVHFALNQGWCSFLHPFDFCSCLLRKQIGKKAFDNSATFDPDISCYSTVWCVILFCLNDDDFLVTTLKWKK